VRYANATGHANTLQVYVDGVYKGDLRCEVTTGWGQAASDILEAKLNLGAIAPGAHTVRFSVSTAGSNTNLDYFYVSDDEMGQRTRMSDPSGYATWTYDTRGRMTQATKVISGTGGGTFVTQYGYDALDRPQWMKYPGGNAGQIGEQVNFAYNNAGQLNSVSGASAYVQSTAYDAAGRVTQRVLSSNVLQQNYVYYPWATLRGTGRLQQIKAGVPDDLTSLQDLNYTYDAVGNVLTILDNKAGPQTQTFTYDALDRLQTAQAVGGSGGTYAQETYLYDKVGNLTSKAGVTQWYSDTLHKHAVTHLNGVQKFWYDANGNMLTRNDNTGNFTQQWDKENRLITVTGTATGAFVYDGDGNRVKATLGATTTIYIGNYYEQSGSITTTYYYAGGTRVAMRQGITVTYLLGDHLGSTAIAANGTTGALLSEQRYKPWGEQRYPSGASTVPTRRQYTGQINDNEIGLYFYGARMYSPYLNRWLSPDTIVPDLANPQSLNRYSYVNNNPLKYIDPTGHEGCAPDNIAACTESDLAQWIASDLIWRDLGSWLRGFADHWMNLLGKSETGNLLLQGLGISSDGSVISFGNVSIGAATGNMASGSPQVILDVNVFLDRLKLVAGLLPRQDAFARQANFDSLANLNAYYAGIIGHELFHMAIGDQGDAEPGGYRNLGDYTSDGRNGIAYVVEAKIVNELVYGGNHANYLKDNNNLWVDWNYGQARPLSKEQRDFLGAIPSAALYFRMNPIDVISAALIH
jgi:RHS repeat-associated protein